MEKCPNQKPKQFVRNMSEFKPIGHNEQEGKKQFITICWKNVLIS